MTTDKQICEKVQGSLGFERILSKTRLEFEEIYAPMVKYTTIRLVLAVLLQQKLMVLQVDVRSSFLIDLLEEKLYVAQPEGLVDDRMENKFPRLQKTLYGLRQAAKA